MNDEVIPLEKLGKRGTVRVYTQSYVEQLKKENAELKAYNEKLLDGDIEKHNKIVDMGKENSRLKQIILGNEMEIAAKDETIEELKKQVEQKQHLADVRLEQSLENYKLFSDERKARIDVDIALEDTTDKLTYAKTIIQDLLDNTDEYARQRAEDFLKENK